MSIGNASHPIRAEHTAQLQRLMADPKFTAAVQAYRTDDDSHDIPFLGGSDNQGRKVFFDRRFAQAIQRGKIKYDGQPYDPRPFVRVHEATEGALLRGQYHPGSIILAVPRRQGFDYPTAHEVATAAERHAVEASGRNWNKHQASMRNIIRITEAEKKAKLPPDLLKLPYEQSEQRESAKPKLSHKAVHYGEGMPQSHCSICAHYIAQGPHCELVVDPILPDAWCSKFQRDTQAISVPRNHPVLKGARQAKDGKFYVPDPNRAGKFMMVVHA